MFSKIPNNANIAKNQARAESMGVSQNFVDPGLITEVCNFEISLKKCIFSLKTWIEQSLLSTSFDILDNSFPDWVGL